MSPSFSDMRPEGIWIRLWPRRWRVYAVLIRWDRPAGSILLLLPALWSLTLCVENLKTPAFFLYGILLTLGSFLIRSVGCIFNDMADVEFDRRVRRTQDRPLAAGTLRHRDALRFAAVLSLLSLLVAFGLGRRVVLFSFIFCPLIILYPFAKRLTFYPQAFLGLLFSAGALMGAAPFSAIAPPFWILYGGTFFWVAGYDTVYAHQDIEDDRGAGVKSTAQLFGRHTPLALAGLYGLALCGWGTCLLLLPESFFFAWGGLGLAGLGLAIQVLRFPFDRPAALLRQFKQHQLIGLAFWAGIVLDKFANSF